MSKPEIQKRIRSKIPVWKAELLRQMRKTELEIAFQREISRKATLAKTKAARALGRKRHEHARKQEAYRRRAEARALFMAASAEYKEHLKKQAELRMQREINQKKALEHGVVIGKQEAPDIVRDIQWVYDNMGKLFWIDPTGAKCFNQPVLQQAPSDGAVAMANYALEDFKSFFDRFVVKLIPRDAGGSDAATAEMARQTEQDRLKELDPSFEDMADFFRATKEAE